MVAEEEEVVDVVDSVVAQDTLKIGTMDMLLAAGLSLRRRRMKVHYILPGRRSVRPRNRLLPPRSQERRSRSIRTVNLYIYE
jgi:hypothetical protein